MQPNDGRVISNFIVQALQNKPITIYGDGSQTRSFCYVDDLVEGLIKLMESNFEDPINLGNPYELTIKNVALEIEKKLSKNLTLEFLKFQRMIPIEENLIYHLQKYFKLDASYTF